MEACLLSTTYFGPVQWYQKLYRSETVYIEQHESFQKQTYRNRCVIATTNGTQTLTVPVEHTTGKELSRGEGHPYSNTIRDLRISSHGKWRTEHWNALQSAYGDSPFFDYYADDLHPFFEKQWTFLFDFNLEITQKMCELLDIQPHLLLTDSYRPLATPSDGDYREGIRPKKPLPDEGFQPLEYYQVYKQKHGFQPNMSILDLLFNMGNESILYL